MRNPPKREPAPPPDPTKVVHRIVPTPTPLGGPWYMMPNGRGSSMPYKRG